MRITRSTFKHGNLFPEVFNFLRHLPDNVLHHNEHRLVHPAAIYTKSFERVTEAFQEVLTLRKPFLKPSRDPNGKPVFEGSRVLMKAQAELLQSLLSHLDDCYQIMRALHPTTEERGSPRFAKDWLEKTGHPTVKNFAGNIKHYRESFAPLVNRLEHEHGRLRFFAFFDINKVIPGYYLEGPDEKGALGPDPEIHPRDTAISLHRDLKFHFANFYIVGKHLKAALNQALRKHDNRNFNTHPFSEYKSEQIERIATEIEGLPDLYFPDELRKEHSRVYLVKDALGAQVSIVFPANIRLDDHLPEQAFFETKGDGYSKIFRCPYGLKHPFLWTPPKIRY